MPLPFVLRSQSKNNKTTEVPKSNGGVQKPSKKRAPKQTRQKQSVPSALTTASASTLAGGPFGLPLPQHATTATTTSFAFGSTYSTNYGTGTYTFNSGGYPFGGASMTGSTSTTTGRSTLTFGNASTTATPGNSGFGFGSTSTPASNSGFTFSSSNTTTTFRSRNFTFGSSNAPATTGSNTFSFGSSNAPATGGSTFNFGSPNAPATTGSNTFSFGSSTAPANTGSSTFTFGSPNAPATAGSSTFIFGSSNATATTGRNAYANAPATAPANSGGNGIVGGFLSSLSSYWSSDNGPDDSCSPTPDVDYLIEEVSLLVLLQIKPRIPDSILNSGTFLTWIVDSTDEDFQTITQYFNNSKGTSDKVRIKNILKITRIGDLEPNGLEHGPRKMLFHGTDSKNIGSILNTGFLPANSRYGGGIFFADRVTKSLTYCFDKNYAAGAGRNNGTGGNYQSQPGGWVFLCEVFLGRACQSHTWSTDLPWGFNSIERPGQWIPDETQNVTISDCVWPIGQTVHYMGNNFYNYGGFGGAYDLDKLYRFFMYSEYIVFRPEQARPQYLIEWEKIP